MMLPMSTSEPAPPQDCEHLVLVDGSAGIVSSEPSVQAQGQAQIQALTYSEAWPDHLIELAARLELNRVQTPDLIQWAVLALEQGLDAPALRRLAGCYAPEPLSDTLSWYQRSLQELDLCLPTADALLDAYTALLARRIVTGDDPVTGLKQITDLNYMRRDWDPLLIPLCDLQAAAELQRDALGNYTWLYSDFDRADLQSLILEECRLYLALQALNPPADLIRSSWCLSCGQRSLPLTRPIKQAWSRRLWRRLNGNPRPLESVCPSCQSLELLPLSSQAGRRRYLSSCGQYDQPGETQSSW
ncbi:MAG: hypothetical protein CVV27_00780 [Candidatus Melainabacteria bacterium HGW-Melainabacteria-1]|nr:MAG: hypothetical protein CVV27_00780 [Candidatus Melainabacteria bacterium HGW-Melainabacteria-1]